MATARVGWNPSWSEGSTNLTADSICWDRKAVSILLLARVTAYQETSKHSKF